MTAQYNPAKDYLITNSVDAAGRLAIHVNAESLSDAQALAQSISTLLGMKVKLRSEDRAATLTSPWEYFYTPGSQGTTVTSPSGVFPL